MNGDGELLFVEAFNQCPMGLITALTGFILSKHVEAVDCAEASSHWRDGNSASNISRVSNMGPNLDAGHV